MCGIVGFIGKSAGKNVIDKLKLLQYRGYDSAGIGICEKDRFMIQKCVGTVDDLGKICGNEILNSSCAIGHTRWATHGKVCTQNAHPCEAGDVAVVHNGIFENFVDIQSLVLGEGKTELDSLVFAKCFDKLLACETELSVKKVTKILHELLGQFVGAWAICALIRQCPGVIFFAKNRSPLVIGKGDGVVCLSSDPQSISDVCKYVCELNDGDFGWVSDKNVQVYNKFGKVSDKIWKQNIAYCDNTKLGDYSCFMEKEIEEGLPSVVDTLANFPDDLKYRKLSLKNHFYLCGCGSAFNAGLCLKYWMGKFLHKQLDCFYASEFNLSASLHGRKSVGIFISQSGETADTIKCVEIAKANKNITIGLVNTQDSTLDKKCDYTLYTFAGKECAVAATKTYVSQLAGGLTFVNMLASQNGVNAINIAQLCAKLRNLDYNNVVGNIKNVVDEIKGKKSVFFIGRGVDYFIAKEAALKLKEITYIHVEAIPAGELKHGSLALIDSESVVICILSQSDLVKKTLNNVAEVKSRGGKVIIFSPFKQVSDYADIMVNVPQLNDEFMPFVLAKPLQLLALYTAKSMGINPDFPRNLAKSVTVE